VPSVVDTWVYRSIKHVEKTLVADRKGIEGKIEANVF
jgi:hypothetical protein